ncbi:MAG: radical SAM protein, partial [Synechococcales bacterium]|nr:radical SAM protein [Synechococcales bacterium]
MAVHSLDARILYVRLPCNPIFPVGVVYLADHVHKLFPEVEQRIFDLGTIPPLDYAPALDAAIDEFQPTLIVFSWRDIQIYAPVGDRGGNPLQYAFEFFYSRNLLEKARGAIGGLRMLAGYYSELWRNEGLIKQGIRRAKRYHPEATVVVGGGAVSVFYEQLQKRLPKGTIVSVGEGESLLEKLMRQESIAQERCYIAGAESPRQRLIHEQPAPIEKTACHYDY